MLEVKWFIGLHLIHKITKQVDVLLRILKPLLCHLRDSLHTNLSQYLKALGNLLTLVFTYLVVLNIEV